MTKKMNLSISEQAAQRVADTAAAGTGVIAGATWVVEVQPYLQVAATLVAIVAGLAATWYHMERAAYMRSKSLGE